MISELRFDLPAAGRDFGIESKKKDLEIRIYGFGF
jgi:hypothetical protein